ncbi:MAG: orotidine-5'-phosphate decarboxylase [Sphingobacteriales bacterium]|nr:MAG: orotidine-5'-phosphate decarboxylase [Sphingobacteriales bacterium]
MNRQQLVSEISRKKSYLCIGLDSDIDKIPKHLLDFPDPVFEFNKQIIDATKEFCVAYKPNIAFYESRGIKGWESLEKTISYISKNIFTIADAKRGDIGNTAEHYAKTFFDTFNFDSVTLSPYMGADTVAPFLEYKDKWIIILGLTSNKGAQDFQMLELKNGEPLYKQVLKNASGWGNAENVMFVAGATRPEQIAEIRQIIPSHFLLVPGIGAQGGDLEKTAQFGLNNDCGLLVNSSRGIIFADSTENFAQAARAEAQKLQKQMQQTMAQKGISM